MKEFILQNGDLHTAMTTWRRHIHQHPETAFEEFATADKIVEVLQKCPNLEIHTGIAKTGVVAVLTGEHGDNGNMIGLRADIDALDICEETEVAYTSTTEGKMHACGHDGHTSMLLGAAHYLSANPHFAGKIAFIFQPAEENSGGGEVMVQDGLFERFPCQSVYGMHNWPGLALGEFAVHEKEVMASTDSFDISIQGNGGHAAMPNLGIDSVVVSSAIITGLQTIVSRNVAPTDTAVVSVTKVNTGSAYNIIPDAAVLSGTLRSFAEPVRALIKKRITELATTIAEAYGASASVDFHDAYPATINNPKYAQECATVCTTLVGQDKVHLDMPPSMGAEDFSYMLQAKPGAYIWLGNGEDSYGLHHPKYNFNDDALALGANYWVALSYHLLAPQQ